MLQFSLNLKKEDIVFSEEVTDENGNIVMKERKYVLYEATGTQRDEQYKFVLEMQKKHGNETIKGIKDHFLGMLLRDKETNAPVGPDFFTSMSGDIRDYLFETAQKLSGMKTASEITQLILKRRIELEAMKLEAEKKGEEWVNPDEEEQKKIEKEEAEGKE